MSLEWLKLKIRILQIQIQILLLRKKLTVPNLPNPEHILIHNGGGDWNFERVNRHHTNLWGFISSLGYGLGYHYWIEDGEVIQARADNEEGAHCADKNRPHYWNKHSIGICVKGNYDVSSLAEEDKVALRGLVGRLRGKYPHITKSHILGHRDIKNTACPGKHLYQWLDNYKKT